MANRASSVLFIHNVCTFGGAAQRFIVVGQAGGRARAYTYN